MPQPLTLVIGNKNYSSWSLRPWGLMTELGIPFSERMLKFDSEDWEANIDRLSPTCLVPVLWEGKPGSGFATFDTSAIVERLADLYPDRGVWPADRGPGLGRVRWSPTSTPATRRCARPCR